MIHKRKTYRRHQRKRAIARKKYICKNVYRFDYYSDDGKYDKGKIHCSCWMCSGKRKYCGLAISDKRKLLAGFDDV